MPSSSSAGVRASELQPTGKGIRPSSRDLESDGRFSTLTIGYEQPEPVLLREFRRRLTRWLEQGGVSDQARHAILLAGHGPPQTGRACRLRAADHRLGHVEHDAISTEVMSGGAWGAHLQPASEERGRGLA